MDADLCLGTAIDLAKEALCEDVGFRIDMEGKQSVDLTIQIAKVSAAGGVQTTIALQAYLKRTLDDLDDLQGIANLRFRLVKGAYAGDDFTAYMTKESYKLLVEALAFLRRPYCIATHDPEILDWLKFSGFVD